MDGIGSIAGGGSVPVARASTPDDVPHETPDWLMPAGLGLVGAGAVGAAAGAPPLGALAVVGAVMMGCALLGKNGNED